MYYSLKKKINIKRNNKLDSFELKSKNNPTCTEASGNIAPHGHIFSSYEIEKEATCLECGQAYAICQNPECNEESFLTIPIKEHDFKNGYCQECGEIDPDFGFFNIYLNDLLICSFQRTPDDNYNMFYLPCDLNRELNISFEEYPQKVLFNLISGNNELHPLEFGEKVILDNLSDIDSVERPSINSLRINKDTDINKEDLLTLVIDNGQKILRIINAEPLVWYNNGNVSFILNNISGQSNVLTAFKFIRNI